MSPLSVMAHHTGPQEAGKLFSQARPKPAVYTHLVFPADQKIPAASVDDMMAQPSEEEP